MPPVIPQLPPIIGLYSPTMGSGKSSVARRLRDRHGYKILNFAGPVKDMAEVFLRHFRIRADDVQEMLHGTLKEVKIKELAVTPRFIMQTLGTEWGREYIDPSIWAMIGVRRAKEYLFDGQKVVFDDMRFPEEYKALLGEKAFLAMVYRPMPDSTDGSTPHRSEGQLTNHQFDCKIRNDSTLDSLDSDVDAMMAKFSEHMYL